MSLTHRTSTHLQATNNNLLAGLILRRDSLSLFIHSQNKKRVFLNIAVQHTVKLCFNLDPKVTYQAAEPKHVGVCTQIRFTLTADCFLCLITQQYTPLTWHGIRPFLRESYF